MKVAEIIVNYNDVESTIKYVQKIKDFNEIDRIVVVDNLSTTTDAFKNLKLLEDSKVKVISADKNGGYDYGNNFGIKYLKSSGESYDYYIISNPDIDIESQAIKSCLEVLEKRKDVAAIAPRMFNKENKPSRRSAWKTRTFLREIVHSTRLLELIFYKVLRNGEYSEKDFEEKELEVEAISGAFFMIRAEALNEINLLDENVFLFYEEDILSKKLLDKNYKIISLNTEKFIHYESQTIGKTFSYYKKMKKLFISKMYFHKKYNKINKLQEIIFYTLFFFRNIELAVEIPIRKMLHK